MPGLTPPPSEALKLLHRLAADPGIVGILTKHRWTVGKLSEMPPEGKVGVSPVCILGVNINAGQEISLRLRTDDLKAYLSLPKNPVLEASSVIAVVLCSSCAQALLWASNGGLSHVWAVMPSCL